MGHYVSIRHNGSLAQAPTGWLFLGILAPSAALLAFAWLQPWVPAASLVRAPLFAATCCGVHHGAIANLGIVLWAATAAICLFAAIMAKAARAERSHVAFFIAGGLFTLCLALDDLFLFHKNVLPLLGIPEAAAFAFYAAAALVHLTAPARGSSGIRAPLFVAAVAALAASTGIDMLVRSDAAEWVFAEGALKFLGIAFWAGFHIAAAAAAAEAFATGRVTPVRVGSGVVHRLAREF
jgi:hypothetical protein